MLDLLTLPLVWLGAYCIGIALDGKSLDVRRWAVVGVSAMALILGCGWRTGAVYVGLSIGIIAFGKLIERLEGKSRQIAFAIAVTSCTAMILGFLRFRGQITALLAFIPSLSYLGFRAISYVTSVYRGEQVSVSTAGTQLLFFPMLFTGPISRTTDFEQSRTDYRQVLRRLIIGLAMLTAGYLLKQEFILPQFMLLRKAADYIPASHFWASMLANSFELYFTFAGYSHLVIGLGLLFGFQLPENFNNPYMSQSIGEFWRKWHMSLSYWIRDYLYIPLGGNRYGLIRKCLHLMFAMGICGIWHGLTMNFLVWGLYHGAMLCVESICAHYRFDPLGSLPDSVSRPIRIVRTFTLVTIGWLLFMYSIPAFWVHMRGLVP